MKKHAIYLSFVFMQFVTPLVFAYNPHLTVVGPLCFADGIGRQSVSIIDCLKYEVSINYICSRGSIDTKDVPDAVRHVVTCDDQTCGSVVVFEDSLDHYHKILDSAPNSIKIAYTMFEKCELPAHWADLLNHHFDAAVVPDEFLVDVYKRSGVTIPIFVLPLSLYLEPFLQKKTRRTPHKPFVFGTSGLLSDRKNQLLLVEAFAHAFGNNPDVCLKLHGRSGLDYACKLHAKINELGLNNVEVIHKPLDWHEYVEFISSLDCFVSLSRGEGFSITPREALAAGVPCIISDNTAHKTLCKTGLVRVVPSHKQQHVSTRGYGCYDPFDFYCTLGDVVSAIKDVFQNYYEYAKESFFAKLWVSKYLHRNLKDRYCSLVKPKELILGPCNEITGRYLMTNSRDLYAKYAALVKP